jgi:hypothetical protein
MTERDGAMTGRGGAMAGRGGAMTDRSGSLTRQIDTDPGNKRQKFFINIKY